jgi:alkylhydroperoxidase/carboxymuconolactone decarboxylase family protein YurZ
VQATERLLRRLAVNDEESLERVLTHRDTTSTGGALGPKVDVLVRLGTLLALGAATTSLRAAVNQATEAGADDAEIVGVLIAVAPAIGLARVVSIAPRLAVAMGYDIDEGE